MATKNVQMKKKPWGKENEDHGHYIIFLVNGKVQWESNLYETDTKDGLEKLRKDVQDELDRWDYVGDIKSTDLDKWRFL